LSLFDHLVGSREQLRGHGEAERLCGLEIDNEFVLGRRLHWKITRLLAFEDTIDIRGRAPIWIAGFRPVVDQAADFRVVTIRIDGRETVASSQRCDLLAMVRKVSGTVIRPPFGSRACAAMTDSSSETS